MPIYRLRCLNGHEQELFQPIEDKQDVYGCPFCPENMYRVPTPFTPIFKGQDFTPKFYPNKGK